MSQPSRGTLSSRSKELCLSHVCPACGKTDYVTAEEVLTGGKSVILCHCRACGHSWHATSEESDGL